MSVRLYGTVHILHLTVGFLNAARRSSTFKQNANLIRRSRSYLSFDDQHRACGVFAQIKENDEISLLLIEYTGFLNFGPN